MNDQNQNSRSRRIFAEGSEPDVRNVLAYREGRLSDEETLAFERSLVDSPLASDLLEGAEATGNEREI